MSLLGWGVVALAAWTAVSGLLVLGWIAVIEIKTVGKGQK